jgi:thiol-disulfide isomerase/thioredoxin
MKKFMCIFLAVIMLLSMAACGGETAQPTEAAVESGSTAIYTVTVETAGGMMLPGLDVFIYADDTLADLKKFGQTDENGQISFELAEGGNYAVVLSGVAKGYDVAESYAFDGKNARITLTSSLIKDESLSGATLGLGDVMYDFSVLTPDGETVSLSQMLSEKKMVLINFWYTTCTYCVAEFPFMEEAYQMYSEDVGIIALNPFEEDAAIKSFQTDMGLSFPMAKCQSAWSATFGISGYPHRTRLCRKAKKTAKSI